MSLAAANVFIAGYARLGLVVLTFAQIIHFQKSGKRANQKRGRKQRVGIVGIGVAGIV